MSSSKKLQAPQIEHPLTLPEREKIDDDVLVREIGKPARKSLARRKTQAQGQPKPHVAFFRGSGNKFSLQKPTNEKRALSDQDEDDRLSNRETDLNPLVQAMMKDRDYATQIAYRSVNRANQAIQSYEEFGEIVEREGAGLITESVLDELTNAQGASSVHSTLMRMQKGATSGETADMKGRVNGLLNRHVTLTLHTDALLRQVEASGEIAAEADPRQLLHPDSSSENSYISTSGNDEEGENPPPGEIQKTKSNKNKRKIIRPKIDKSDYPDVRKMRMREGDKIYEKVAGALAESNFGPVDAKDGDVTTSPNSEEEENEGSDEETSGQDIEIKKQHTQKPKQQQKVDEIDPLDKMLSSVSQRIGGFQKQLHIMMSLYAQARSQMGQQSSARAQNLTKNLQTAEEDARRAQIEIKMISQRLMAAEQQAYRLEKMIQNKDEQILALKAKSTMMPKPAVARNGSDSSMNVGMIPSSSTQISRLPSSENIAALAEGPAIPRLDGGRASFEYDPQQQQGSVNLKDLIPLTDMIEAKSRLQRLIQTVKTVLEEKGKLSNTAQLKNELRNNEEFLITKNVNLDTRSVPPGLRPHLAATVQGIFGLTTEEVLTARDTRGTAFDAEEANVLRRKLEFFQKERAKSREIGEELTVYVEVLYKKLQQRNKAMRALENLYREQNEQLTAAQIFVASAQHQIDQAKGKRQAKAPSLPGSVPPTSRPGQQQLPLKPTTTDGNTDSPSEDANDPDEEIRKLKLELQWEKEEKGRAVKRHASEVRALHEKYTQELGQAEYQRKKETQDLKSTIELLRAQIDSFTEAGSKSRRQSTSNTLSSHIPSSYSLIDSTTQKLEDDELENPEIPQENQISEPVDPSAVEQGDEEEKILSNESGDNRRHKKKHDRSKHSGKSKRERRERSHEKRSAREKSETETDAMLSDNQKNISKPTSDPNLENEYSVHKTAMADRDVSKTPRKEPVLSARKKHRPERRESKATIEEVEVENSESELSGTEGQESDVVGDAKDLSQETEKERKRREHKERKERRRREKEERRKERKKLREERLKSQQKESELSTEQNTLSSSEGSESEGSVEGAEPPCQKTDTTPRHKERKHRKHKESHRSRRRESVVQKQEQEMGEELENENEDSEQSESEAKEMDRSEPKDISPKPKERRHRRHHRHHHRQEKRKEERKQEVVQDGNESDPEVEDRSEPEQNGQENVDTDSKPITKEVKNEKKKEKKEKSKRSERTAEAEPSQTMSEDGNESDSEEPGRSDPEQENVEDSKPITKQVKNEKKKEKKERSKRIEKAERDQMMSEEERKVKDGNGSNSEEHSQVEQENENVGDSKPNTKEVKQEKKKEKSESALGEAEPDPAISEENLPENSTENPTTEPSQTTTPSSTLKTKTPQKPTAPKPKFTRSSHSANRNGKSVSDSESSTSSSSESSDSDSSSLSGSVSQWTDETSSLSSYSSTLTSSSSESEVVAIQSKKKKPQQDTELQMPSPKQHKPSVTFQSPQKSDDQPVASPKKKTEEELRRERLYGLNKNIAKSPRKRAVGTQTDVDRFEKNKEKEPEKHSLLNPHTLKKHTTNLKIVLSNSLALHSLVFSSYLGGSIDTSADLTDPQDMLFSVHNAIKQLLAHVRKGSNIGSPLASPTRRNTKTVIVSGNEMMGSDNEKNVIAVGTRGSPRPMTTLTAISDTAIPTTIELPPPLIQQGQSEVQDSSKDDPSLPPANQPPQAETNTTAEGLQITVDNNELQQLQLQPPPTTASIISSPQFQFQIRKTPENVSSQEQMEKVLSERNRALQQRQVALSNAAAVVAQNGATQGHPQTLDAEEAEKAALIEKILSTTVLGEEPISLPQKESENKQIPKEERGEMSGGVVEAPPHLLPPASDLLEPISSDDGFVRSMAKTKEHKKPKGQPVVRLIEAGSDSDAFQMKSSSSDESSSSSEDENEKDFEDPLLAIMGNELSGERMAEMLIKNGAELTPLEQQLLTENRLLREQLAAIQQRAAEATETIAQLLKRDRALSRKASRAASRHAREAKKLGLMQAHQSEEDVKDQINKVGALEHKLKRLTREREDLLSSIEKLMTVIPIELPKFPLRFVQKTNSGPYMARQRKLLKKRQKQLEALQNQHPFELVAFFDPLNPWADWQTLLGPNKTEYRSPLMYRSRHHVSFVPKTDRNSIAAAAAPIPLVEPSTAIRQSFANQNQNQFVVSGPQVSNSNSQVQASGNEQMSPPPSIQGQSAILYPQNLSLPLPPPAPQPLSTDAAERAAQPPPPPQLPIGGGGGTNAGATLGFDYMGNYVIAENGFPFKMKGSEGQQQQVPKGPPVLHWVEFNLKNGAAQPSAAAPISNVRGPRLDPLLQSPSPDPTKSAAKSAINNDLTRNGQISPTPNLPISKQNALPPLSDKTRPKALTLAEGSDFSSNENSPLVRRSSFQDLMEQGSIEKIPKETFVKMIGKPSPRVGRILGEYVGPPTPPPHGKIKPGHGGQSPPTSAPELSRVLDPGSPSFTNLSPSHGPVISGIVRVPSADSKFFKVKNHIGSPSSPALSAFTNTSVSSNLAGAAPTAAILFPKGGPSASEPASLAVASAAVMKQMQKSDFLSMPPNMVPKKEKKPGEKQEKRVKFPPIKAKE